MRIRRALLVGLVLVIAWTTSGNHSSTGLAAELPTFTDPAEAGPDFQVQGEYAGNVGSGFPIGIQVIALGNHEFQGVVFAGGLPGAGWDESTVSHIGGKTREDGRTVFHGIHGERLKFASSNFRGSIRDSVFTGARKTGAAMAPGSLRISAARAASTPAPVPRVTCHSAFPDRARVPSSTAVTTLVVATFVETNNATPSAMEMNAMKARSGLALR